MKPITFYAALPDIQGAIKMHGGGDGFRITLDVPQSERDAIVRLSGLINTLLRVLIMPDEEGQNG